MGKEGTKEKLDIELEAPADFTSPEVLYQDLVKTIHKYHPSDDISMIEKAYKIAAQAHKDQKRKSGEPYIIHPLCVAIILADLEMDKETIAAGLLHDVVEDTVMTLDEQRTCERCSLLWQRISGSSSLSWQTVFTICVPVSTGSRKSRRKKQERPWRSMLLLQTVWVFPRLRSN